MQSMSETSDDTTNALHAALLDDSHILVNATVSKHFVADAWQFRWALAAIRFVAIIFSNLKLVYIGIQLGIICNISYSLQATGVDRSCNWYWGPYDIYDDDYINNEPLIKANSDGSYFKMTCAYDSCEHVCPDSCNTYYWEGSTSNVTNAHNVPLTACVITFHYLNLTFCLIMIALLIDALVQYMVGMHMLYAYITGKGKWLFLPNLHQRTPFMALIFLLRPGLFYRFLTHPSVELYPTQEGVEKVPFLYFILFALAVDAPYVTGSMAWALFNDDTLSMYLVLASFANLCATLMYVYCMQIREDLNATKAVSRRDAATSTSGDYSDTRQLLNPV